jgi:DNA polymerase-3 subunit delta'
VSVFADLVGQERVVAELEQAVAAAAAVLRGDPESGMTHAWLFTGPPGSGRSVAARAFAAALQCADGGCGACHQCHTALGGTHPDVDVVVPEGLHLVIREAREIVARSARAPSQGRWQVMLIEDADRMEERTGNTLLKAIEEPPPRSVFLLCAPSPDDLLPTIRSRCRLLTLRIPPYDAVAVYLERRFGVDRSVAAFAARAAQAHVGRARRLAEDDEVRRRRREVLTLPTSVASVPACFGAAASLVDAAKEEASGITDERDSVETAALRESLGEVGGRGGVKSRGAAGELSALDKRQKTRAKRTQRDVLDRAMLDLAAFYRDVLAVQFGGGESPVELVNADLATTIGKLARSCSPESTLRRIEAVLRCREAIDSNVPPLLAAEAMALALHAG